MNYKIHHTAQVQTKNIGKNTEIWQFVIILKNATIGKDCNINSHVFIENDVEIGNNVTIKPGVQLWDGLRVRNNVFIGPNVTFTNDIIPRSKNHLKPVIKTIINEGVSIGANSTIIAGNTLRKYSFIGAGSVVTKNTAPFSVWYGNPAKHKGYITKNGIILNIDLLDKSGNVYVISEEGPVLKND
jgi:UDP-2-acetamido-3-amino-2,3-dideoxy-glucuronate N-acetyltransferase